MAWRQTLINLTKKDSQNKPVAGCKTTRMNKFLLVVDKANPSPLLSSIFGATPTLCKSESSTFQSCSVLWRKNNEDKITEQQTNKKGLIAL